MPCRDVTETIHVVLDDEDRLVHYTLTKRHRGSDAGECALLEGQFAGWTLEAILGLEAGEFLAGHHFTDKAGEFLALKHFFTLRMALEVLTGRAAGGVGEKCMVASVIHDGKNLHVEADIPTQWAVEKTAARGVCHPCGERKQEAANLCIPCFSRIHCKGHK
jgi:hypothetical protein